MSHMSQEGYDELVAKLRKLETEDRPAASQAIAEARDKGDLSENYEYHSAKEAQAKLEARINKLKAELMNAKIVDKSRLKGDVVQILSKVEMTNLKTGARMAYTIVSESEANLREGKISIQTPIAQGLLGKKVGDEAKIQIPQGVIELRIESISLN
ncbi:MAG: transcription elongation factor GreA [Prevotella sp.]|nr:transcription elongation factor GreA [Candidatus Equicola faecalis]MDO4820029.1 transcription elongation factor GreA [Prevotella sp.]